MTGAEDWVTDRQQLASLCQELLETWYQGERQLTFRNRGKAPNPGKFLVVWGLACHVHEIAQTALRLLDDDLDVAAAPLVRLAYEGAITAQWVSQADDGAEAFYNEEERSRTAAAKDLTVAPNAVMQEVGARILEKDRTSHASSSEQQARHFKQRCLDLTPGGIELYAYYRALCLGAHPTPHAVDRYAVPNDDRTDVRNLTKLAAAEEGGSDWLFYLLTVSVVLAGRAVDYQDDTKRRRSQLRRAAKALGSTSELQLTVEAKRRIAKDAQARRRADRKPRRRRQAAPQ